MFQYSFSLCLVAFFSAILRLSDGRRTRDEGRRRRTLLELSTALLCRRRCSTLVFAQESAAGVGSFQPLNGQMRDIKQFALASFSESFAGYSSYLVRFGFTSAPFFFVLRQSILLLYVFPFSCRPLGWSLYLYLFVGSRERGGGDMQSACVCAGVSFLGQRSGMGSVRIYAQSLGVSICLLGVFAYTANVRPSVRPTVRPTVRPAVRLSRPACRYVLSCVLFM